MTCIIYPSEDPLFLRLADILDWYCVFSDCKSCEHLKRCQRLFDSMCGKSRKGILTQTEFESQIQKLVQAGFLPHDIIVKEVDV